MPIGKYLHSSLACAGCLLSAAGLQAVTITANPSAVAISYKKGATAVAATAKVSIAPSTGPAIYFTVDPTTLQPWLQVDRTNGTASPSTPISLTFGPSPVVSTLAAGTYTAVVGIHSDPLAPITIAVTLSVVAAPATVTATLSGPLTWTPGSKLPTATLTVKSSSDPVSFTVTASPTWILLGATSGVAYSWGTTVGVTFAQWGFDNAPAGSNLAGSITVRGANNTLGPLSLSVAVGLPVVTITGSYPAKLPQSIAAGSTRTVSVSGTNFVNGMQVTLGSSSTPLANNCASFAAATVESLCIQSSTQFFLKLSDTYLAGAAAAGKVTIHIGAQSLDITVTNKPIITAVTDSAALVQTSPLTVSPYEMISIFGDNFTTVPVIYGAPDQNGRYTTQLNDGSQDVKVHFMDSIGNDLAADTWGYLLLATPNQINVLVPSALPVIAGGGELMMTVQYGALPPSDAVILNVGAASPGVFTFGGGVGQAVVVNGDGTINSSTNPAKLMTPASSITLYLSGLGVPNGGGATAGIDPGTSAMPAACATPGSFLTALGWAQSFDGAILASAVLGQNVFPPCFSPAAVTVKIGKVAAGSVAYAGWVADSIVGLYQVNLTLPTTNAGLTPTTAGGTAYPLVVTVGGTDSQSSVVVYLK